MSERDVIKLVLECIESCLNLWSSDSEELRRFRTRARSIGSEYPLRGLAYVIILLAARSNKEAIEIGLNADTCKDVVEKIRTLRERRRLSLEEFSYALYGAIFAYIIKRLGIVKASSFGELLRQILDRPSAETRTLNVVEWIKRLAEAYIYAEK